MSLRDFWVNVRVASGLPLYQPVVDLPKLDPGQIEQNLRASDRWLTPKSVEGFNVVDFSFLSQPEIDALTEQVRRFRKVAFQVPWDTAPTPEQVEQAIPSLVKIIEMLEFHRYGDAEAYRLGRQIENAIQSRRPPMLVELRFYTGPDSTGDPGLWIYSILEEGTVEEPAYWQKVKAIDRLLDSESRSVAPERWPYTHIRTVSEQAEIEGTPVP